MGALQFVFLCVTRFRNQKHDNVICHEKKNGRYIKKTDQYRDERAEKKTKMKKLWRIAFLN